MYKHVSLFELAARFVSLPRCNLHHSLSRSICVTIVSFMVFMLLASCRVASSGLGQLQAMKLFCKDLLRNKSIAVLR